MSVLFSRPPDTHTHVRMLEMVESVLYLCARMDELVFHDERRRGNNLSHVRVLDHDDVIVARFLHVFKIRCAGRAFQLCITHNALQQYIIFLTPATRSVYKYNVQMNV